LLNFEISLPGALGISAFKKAMLRRFRDLMWADLAHRGDPHALQLGANREPTVQGEPNEGAHLAGAETMLDFGQHLKVRGVLEVQLLDEGMDNRDFGWSLRVHVSSFG